LHSSLTVQLLSSFVTLSAAKGLVFTEARFFASLRMTPRLSPWAEWRVSVCAAKRFFASLRMTPRLSPWAEWRVSCSPKRDSSLRSEWQF